ncbi:seven in absentia homolog 3 [Bombina bombina]|uniref:seven in absentia homolog 3 n=1 Tax=Bombina bombina TaxID=8345 RepID=UPI00235A7449|nr:seven in absentia homolog 3 [Bombina bombina]
MLFFTQCFGAVLDLIHFRFQHYQAKRVVSSAGQLVCVVSPTQNLKNGSEQSATPEESSQRTSTQHHHDEMVYDPQLTFCTCPLYTCRWEGHLEVVVSHLTKNHKISILQGTEVVFLATDMDLPAPVDWIITHSCLGHHFLLVLRKEEKYQGYPQFFASMMLIGTPAQAENFNYKLELSRNRRRLTWESTPRSVLDCVDSVMTDGDCLVLNASVAQLFSDNGSLAIGIAITASRFCAGESEM